MIYEFQATQDLHGYDKPWAPGAGTNLFDKDDPNNVVSGYINSNGIFSASSSGEKTITMQLPSGTYTVSKVRTSRFIVARFDSPVTSGDAGTIISSNPNNSSVTFSVSDNEVIMCFIYNSSGEQVTFDEVLNSVQIEAGSSATSYVPYSNICMPEGFNIWDPSQDKMIQVYAGYVNANTRELYLRPVYEEYAGEELVGPWMSSLDPYAEDTTPTEGAFVIDFGGELTSFEITPFMLQTLLDSLGIRQHFTDGAGLLNSLMDQAQGRVRSEEELLHLSRPLKVIAIGDQLPAGLTFKPISKDVLPGLPGKFIR